MREEEAKYSVVCFKDRFGEGAKRYAWSSGGERTGQLQTTFGERFGGELIFNIGLLIYSSQGPKSLRALAMMTHFALVSVMLVPPIAAITMEKCFFLS